MAASRNCCLPKDLVAVDDAPDLAKKIHEVLADPVPMRRMSVRNLDKVKEYGETPGEGREAFHRQVKVQVQANGASFTPISIRSIKLRD